MREKDYGIWQSWSWAEVAAEVEALAGGLKRLGFRRGDKLAIIGDNRPRLYWAIAATQALGGVPVPIYQDSIADEMAYVLEHAEVRFAVAEDQEQVDKLVAVKERCPLPRNGDLLRPARAATLRAALSPFVRSGAGAGARLRPRPTRRFSRPRSRKGAAPIPRSSSTPRARPAGQRASC